MEELETLGDHRSKIIGLGADSEPFTGLRWLISRVGLVTLAIGIFISTENSAGSW